MNFKKKAQPKQLWWEPTWSWQFEIATRLWALMTALSKIDFYDNSSNKGFAVLWKALKLWMTTKLHLR